MYTPQHTYDPDEQTGGWGANINDEEMSNQQQQRTMSRLSTSIHSRSSVNTTNTARPSLSIADTLPTPSPSPSNPLSTPPVHLSHVDVKLHEKPTMAAMHDVPLVPSAEIDHVRAPLPVMAPFSIMHDNAQIPVGDYTRLPSPQPQHVMHTLNDESMPNTTPNVAQPTVDQGPSTLRRIVNAGVPLYFLVSAVLSFVFPAVYGGACRTSLSTYSYGCGVSNLCYMFLSMTFLHYLPNTLSDLSLQGPHTIGRWMLLILIKQLMGMADMGWFIWGNVLVFSSGASDSASEDAICHPLSSSPLYRWVLVTLIQGYAGIGVPLLAFIYLAIKYPEYVFPSREQLAATRADAQKQQRLPCPEAVIAQCEVIEYSEAGWGNVCNKIKELKSNSSVPHGPSVDDARDANCAICLSSYTPQISLRLLPCSHHFHTACVDEWLHQHNSCPMCKRTVEEALKEKKQKEKKREKEREKAKREGNGGVQPFSDALLAGTTQV